MVCLIEFRMIDIFSLQYFCLINIKNNFVKFNPLKSKCHSMKLPMKIPMFHVAPMMDYTNRYHRHFMRLLLKSNYLLYTEMVTSHAVLHNWQNLDAFQHARFKLDLESLSHQNKSEKLMAKKDPLLCPGLNSFWDIDDVCLQLGGSDVRDMALAANIGYKTGGYRDININAGCPSSKVAGAGCFGASLMLKPELLVDIARSIHDINGFPPSVKCRIGVTTEHKSSTFDDLCFLVRELYEKGGVTTIVIHARYAVLNKKFSPHDNRTIPPIQYDVVYRLCSEFPHLKFIVNGDIRSYEGIRQHMEAGVGLEDMMIGRSVLKDPFLWFDFEKSLLNDGIGVDTNTVCSHNHEEKAASPDHTPSNNLSERVNLCRAYTSHMQLVEQTELQSIKNSNSTGKEIQEYVGKQINRRRFMVKPLFDVFYGFHGNKKFKTYLNECIHSGGNQTLEWIVEQSLQSSCII